VYQARPLLLTMHPTRSAITDIRRELAAFARPSDLRGALAIAANWALIACCCSCWPWIESHTRGLLFAGFRVIELLVLTSRVRALESLTHEATHHTLFRTRALNMSLQWLYALPVGHEVRTYGVQHIVHHRALGKPEDPAQLLFVRHGVTALPKRFWWTMIVRPLSGYHTADWLLEKRDYFSSSPPYRFWTPLFWALCITAMFALHRLDWLVFHWLVALAVMFPVVEFWAEVDDHAAIRSDAIGQSRTNIGFLHRLLFHTHNDGYHAVHHISPNIPGHLLPAAHAYLVAVAPSRDAVVEARSVSATIAHLRSR
jgi:fatty acid desaturase